MAEDILSDGDTPIPYDPSQIEERVRKPSTIPPAIAPPVAGTPPATAPPILGTAWSSVTDRKPYGGNVGPLLDITQPTTVFPGIISADPGNAFPRIAQAAKEGFEASRPDILPATGPLSRAALEQYPVNRAINLPALDIVRNAVGLLGGAGRGVQQMGKEVLSDLDPILGSSFSRDVSSIPDAFAGSPQFFSDLQSATPFVPPDPRLPRVWSQTSTGAFDAGRIGYTNLHQSGLTYAPDFVNKAIDGIVPEDPQALARAALSGPSVVTEKQLAMQAFRDKPLSIQQYQGMMQGLSDAIETETKDGMTPAGKKLLEMRDQLRSQFENASGSDVSSGNPADIQALLDANKATFQGYKMQDIERMWDKASRTENPTASIKTQVKNFVTDEADTRGWTTEEKAALERAGERGTLGTMYYGLGSGLSKAAGMGAGAYLGGAKYGPLGGVGGMYVGNLAGQAASYPFRFMANRVANQRIKDALSILGQSVPDRPLPLPEPELPPISPQAQQQAGPRPQPAWGAWDNGQ